MLDVDGGSVSPDSPPDRYFDKVTVQLEYLIV